MSVDFNENVVGYVEGLSFYRAPDAGPWTPVRSPAAVRVEPPIQAAVNVGAVVAFADNVPQAQRQDILDSVQLAQRAATGEFDRHKDTERWYGKFIEVMQRVGWVTSQFAFAKQDQEQGELKVDARALQIVATVAAQGALGVLTKSLSLLEGMADGDHAISVYRRFASTNLSGNFQLGTAEVSPQGALSVGLGAFYFGAKDQQTRTLFGSYGANRISFWSAAQRMTLNQQQFDKARIAVQKALGDPSAYVAELQLA